MYPSVCYISEGVKKSLYLDCIAFPITPHVFRHSKAMHMLHAGINLFYIRDILGHVDVSTTEIYAREIGRASCRERV